MASIRKEILLAAAPEAVWDVVRDIGAVATRFAPGFVVNVQMEPGARLVTFGNGMVARETIVDLDETIHELIADANGHHVHVGARIQGVGTRASGHAQLQRIAGEGR